MRSGMSAREEALRFRHALVVGGTGMLSEATAVLAARAEALTVVARTARSLQGIGTRIGGEAARIHTLQLDWSAPVAFLECIRMHVRNAGYPDGILAWLHDDALAVALAEAATASAVPCRFIHVRSSQTQDPARSGDAVAAAFSAMPQVRYQQVILGFVLAGCASRWLTHAEIAGGAIAAMSRPGEARIVVGVTKPWSMRP